MTDETTPQDSAAMPPASAGSQPVAWAVMQPDSCSVFASRALAEKMRELCDGGDIVPLYRAPTLTDEEREAIEYLLLGGCEGPEDEEKAMREKVRAFLQRTK